MPDTNLTESRSNPVSIRLASSDQRCLCCLVIGIFAFSLLELASQENHSRQAGEPVRFQLDLNSAGVEELVLLPGIGEVRAASIVRYRSEFGPFQTVDELRRIKGIGPKTLSGLKEMVYVHPLANETPRQTAEIIRYTNQQERKIAALADRLE
ncbi:MAG TPA: ComEA family DNA-binding protein [Planctomycetaceae bacterium]|nr:ComEA family DNA-binding protein [Planctomycetaceae bacterium]